MINQVAIMDSQTAWNELLRCKKAGQKYQIWFRKDDASIRADQVKAEAERARKLKAQEDQRKREEAEKRIREEAEKKRADELAAKKQEYWEKQNAGGVAADVAAAAPAEGGEAPAEGAPAAGEGGG